MPKLSRKLTPTPCSHFFTTQIELTRLKAATPKFLRELKTEISQIQSIDRKGVLWSKAHYPAGYTSYASFSNLHETSPSFARLKLEIDRHVQKFAAKLDMELTGHSIWMNSCWVNVMPPNAHHSSHLHPLSFISGTFYVDVPQGSAPLKFEDPRLASMMYAPPKRANAKAENQTFISFEPEPGNLILFESYLRHEVPSQQAKGQRISVSFNYSWS